MLRRSLHLSYRTTRRGRISPAFSAIESETRAIEQPEPGSAPSLVSVRFVEPVARQLDYRVAERLRGEGQRLGLHVLGLRRLRLPAIEQIEGDLGAEPRGRHAETRVADRVGGPAAVRGAE